MKRFLFLLISALMLLGLVSCAAKPDLPDDSSSENSPQEVILIADGKTEYTIVRSENAGNAVCEAAVSLFQKVSVFSEELTIKSDLFRSVKHLTGPAIYVGMTSEEPCLKLTEVLKSDDFVISTDGVNIFLIGGSEKGTVSAVEYFIKNVVDRAADGNLVWNIPEYIYHKNYSVSDFLIGGTPVSDFVIVYDHGSDYYKQCAESLQKQISILSGYDLAVRSDTTPATVHEILVGATVREESKIAVSSLNNDYNLWTARCAGEKFVITGAGIRSSEAAVNSLIDSIKDFCAKKENCSIDLTDFACDGDATSGAKASRDSAADVRIMTANILLTTNTSISNANRAKIFCDIVHTYAPDVICFNEFYYDPAKFITEGLEDDYIFLKPDFEDVFNSDYSGYTNDLSKLQSHECAEIIAYRKDAGLRVIASGFRYTTEKWWVHGISWVLFERADGARFVAMANHYGEQSIADFGAETVNVIKEIRQKYGNLPIIVTGDLYAWAGDKPHQTILNAGLYDTYAERTTRVTQARGSFHEVGSIMTGTDSPIDHILVTDGIRTLKHHLIADKYSIWTSDHFPIYADIVLPK